MAAISSAHPFCIGEFTVHHIVEPPDGGVDRAVAALMEGSQCPAELG
jgi:hypothetical protein